MKILKYIKEKWLSWLLSIFMLFPIIFNQEISTISKNLFLIYLTQSIPFVIVILSIIFLSIINAIDENLWDDFKKGRDIHIDRMMKNIKIIFILMVISNSLWFFLILYNLNISNELGLMKSIILLFTPLLIVISTFKVYNNLQKDYTK